MVPGNLDSAESTTKAETYPFLCHYFQQNPALVGQWNILVWRQTQNHHQESVFSICFNFIIFLPSPVRWQRPRVNKISLQLHPPCPHTHLTANCLPEHSGSPRCHTNTSESTIMGCPGQPGWGQVAVVTIEVSAQGPQLPKQTERHWQEKNHWSLVPYLASFL